MTSWGKRRERREAGAVLVEASIGLSLLMLLTAGIVEYGSVFASGIDTSAAVRSGARSGVVVTATGPTTDYDIVQSSVQGSGTRREQITKIIVYKADAENGVVPPACINATSSLADQKCNVYNKSDFLLPRNVFNALDAGEGWPSVTRNPGVDYLGVWIEVTRQPLMKDVGSPEKFSDYLVMRLSPVGSAVAATEWGPAVSGAHPGWDPELWGCWQGTCHVDAHEDGATPDGDSEPGGSG